MTKTCLLIASILATAVPTSAIPSASPRTLSEEQMRGLAIDGARVWAPRTLKVGFSFERHDEGGYAYFEEWASVGQGVAGRYAIDPRTGDIWNAYGDCRPLSSPEIRRLQRKFRRQLGLSPTQYLKIRRSSVVGC